VRYSLLAADAADKGCVLGVVVVCLICAFAPGLCSASCSFKVQALALAAATAELRVLTAQQSGGVPGLFQPSKLVCVWWQ
jgi:hypothetical protein